MAINFSEKYSSKIAEVFTHESFLKGLFTAQLDFTGAKTVKVYRLVTVAENDYQRTGTNRYGTPTDVQDVVDEYTMSEDKSFSQVVDKGDGSDQAISNKAGAWLKAQLREQSTPAADKHALSKLATEGTVLSLGAAPDKDSVVEMFVKARTAMTNALVPDSGRFAIVPASSYAYIPLAPQFVNLEKLGTPAVGKGHVGQLLGFQLIEVPDQYFPEGVHAIFLHESAACMPYKLDETHIHKDPPGISGALIEGRHYYDCFVLQNKKNAVLAAKT